MPFGNFGYMLKLFSKIVLVNSWCMVFGYKDEEYTYPLNKLEQY